MATQIRQFTCQQNRSKQASIDLTPSICKSRSDYATKLDSSTRTQAFHCSFLIPLMKSKPEQFCQDTFDSSFNHQRQIKRRTLTLGTGLSAHVKEEKRDKKRTNRDSLFSLISVKTRNNDVKFTERSNEKMKGKAYTLYPLNSNVSSTTTLDSSNQSTCQGSVQSPDDESSSISVSTALASSPMTSPDMTPVTSSSILQEEMLKKTNSLLRDDKYEIDTEKYDTIMTNESIPDSNGRHLNFFQEHQDQEYKIAKAWLEAEESRTASPSTSGLDVICLGSSEFNVYDPWITHPSLTPDNRLVTGLTGRYSGEYLNIRESALKSMTPKPKSSGDVDVQYEGLRPTHYFKKSRSLSEGKDLSNMRQKHISSMSGLAHGVRKLLGRRTSSS